MDLVRQYGDGPFEIVVVHGGPGAPGYMAPVARGLSKYGGVIEPLQSATTLNGQIEELAEQISEFATTPCVVVGSSWGANLSLFLASHHPELVKKVIMIGSSVFDAESSDKVKEIRAARMSDRDSEKSDKLMTEIGEADSDSKRNKIFEQLADCLFESDTFDPDTKDLEIVECQYSVNKSVWSDFKVLRDQPGKLAEIHSKIECPVINIHGDYDPHIIEGIQPFLESCLRDVKLYCLEKCGHYPWIEKQAKEHFFEILKKEAYEL